MFLKLLIGWDFPVTEFVLYELVLFSFIYLWQYMEPAGLKFINPVYTVLIIYFGIIGKVVDWTFNYLSDSPLLICRLIILILGILVLIGYVIFQLQLKLDISVFYKTYSDDHYLTPRYLNMPIAKLAWLLCTHIIITFMYYSSVMVVCYFILAGELLSHDLSAIVQLFTLYHIVYGVHLWLVLSLIVRIELMLYALEYRLFEMWEDYQEPPWYILLVRKYPGILVDLVISFVFAIGFLLQAYLFFFYSYSSLLVMFNKTPDYMGTLILTLSMILFEILLLAYFILMFKRVSRVYREVTILVYSYIEPIIMSDIVPIIMSVVQVIMSFRFWCGFGCGLLCLVSLLFYMEVTTLVYSYIVPIIMSVVQIIMNGIQIIMNGIQVIMNIVQVMMSFRFWCGFGCGVLSLLYILFYMEVTTLVYSYIVLIIISVVQVIISVVQVIISVVQVIMSVVQVIMSFRFWCGFGCGWLCLIYILYLYIVSV